MKKTRLEQLGYCLAEWKRDCFGKLHRFRTSPNSGGGPTNYFNTATQLMQYIKDVEQVREWQQIGGTQ